MTSTAYICVQATANTSSLPIATVFSIVALYPLMIFVSQMQREGHIHSYLSKIREKNYPSVCDAVYM